MVANITQAFASGTVTELALELDRAMASSESARAAYLATWGVEWVALAGLSLDVQVKSHATSTTMRTVR